MQGLPLLLNTTQESDSSLRSVIVRRATKRSPELAVTIARSRATVSSLTVRDCRCPDVRKGTKTAGLLAKRERSGVACQQCKRTLEATNTAASERSSRLFPAFHPQRFTLRTGPVGNDCKLGSRLVWCMDRVQPHAAWISMLPRRLGNSRATDAATEALVEALKYYCGPGVDEASALVAMQAYGHAVVQLRAAITSPHEATSDGSLAAVALLTLCELLMKEWCKARKQAISLHWSGIRSILLEQSKKQEVSDLAREIYCTRIGEITIGLSLPTGDASPFETSGLNHGFPAGCIPNQRQAAYKLRNIAVHVMTRLPRLIAYLRTLRSGSADFENFKLASALSHELAALKDDQAETQMLRQFRTRPTAESTWSSVVPYVFQFDDPQAAYDGVVIYWYSRCAVLSCRLRLLKLAPHANTDKETARLQAEKDRYSMNGMMSWEGLSPIGPFATLWLAAGLLTNWLHIRSVDTWRGIDTVNLRAWMLPKLNHPLMEYLDGYGDEATMDAAADLCEGGPIVGMIADMSVPSAASNFG